jgi:hypothetical protein
VASKFGNNVNFGIFAQNGLLSSRLVLQKNGENEVQKLVAFTELSSQLTFVFEVVT